MAGCMTNDAIDTKLLEIRGITIFHHDIGYEAFIGLMWYRRFDKEPAD